MWSIIDEKHKLVFFRKICFRGLFHCHSGADKQAVDSARVLHTDTRGMYTSVRPWEDGSCHHHSNKGLESRGEFEKPGLVLAGGPGNPESPIIRL